MNDCKEALISIVESYIEMYPKSQYYKDVLKQVKEAETNLELDILERVIDDWIDY